MGKGLFFDRSAMNIFDERVPRDVLLIGGMGVSYTLETDDITVGVKPDFTPYVDRFDSLKSCDDRLIGGLTGSTLTVESTFGGGLKFCLECENDRLSEYGVCLPFNFMGKKNGGGYENQFLFNSPYRNEETGVLYFYLTKPNGANLLVAAKGEVAGWKMDYAPEAYGHFFSAVKILKNFDKAYGGCRRNGGKLEFSVFPVKDFSDCLDKLSEYYGMPFLDCLSSGGIIGEKIKLFLHGKADGLVIKHGDEVRKAGLTNEFTVDREGLTEIIPEYRGVCGAGAKVYGVSDIVDLYKRSMDSVDLDVLAFTDGNLCESQCWVSAMLRFLINHKDRLSKAEISVYESKLKKQLAIITETDPAKALPRTTVLKGAYKNFPPYHIFESTRLQEQFFGVTIFLDAYKYFKDEKYYDYAVGAAECLIDNYQGEDGGLYRPTNSGAADYTTVCCPVIPLIDLANYLVGKDDERAKKFLSAAEKMAEHVYDRGFDFPTETAKAEDYEGETEEGSVSCSALVLLYYCKMAKRVERYIKRAKEFLDLHESWVMRSVDCRMKNSTLRWWETLWEGDADGPCICAGHAWTIWRAEADILYYELTGDENYLIKAKNGFTTNLAKIDVNGVSYANFDPDMINGGGFKKRSEEVVFKIAGDFPTRPDSGLSRYVWIRMSDTFLRKTK